MHRRLEDRRGQAGTGRNLHQHRLHSLEGAAAVLREFRARRPRFRGARNRRQGPVGRCTADARPQGQSCPAKQRRDRLPVQEEQDRVLPRRGQLRRRHVGRVANQSGGFRRRVAHREERDRCDRLQAAGVSCQQRRRGVRQPADPRQRWCAGDPGGADEAGRGRCRRHRPRDGERLASVGCRGDDPRSASRFLRRRRRAGREGGVEAFHEAGPRDRARRKHHEGDCEEGRCRRLHRRRGQATEQALRQADRLDRTHSTHRRTQRRGRRSRARRTRVRRR